ncbi:MAG: hypothetical protein KGJ80_15360 [Chloroflexota bacterium]|nr:hypothetical protein [Chloroflexota bacterium]
MNIPRITQSDLHPHLKARMEQRGVTLDEIQRALDEGWMASDARIGTVGRTLVFPYTQEWEGAFYPEKEVTVYHKIGEGGIILLTVKARYGSGFPRGEAR